MAIDALCWCMAGGTCLEWPVDLDVFFMADFDWLVSQVLGFGSAESFCGFSALACECWSGLLTFMVARDLVKNPSKATLSRVSSDCPFKKTPNRLSENNR